MANGNSLLISISFIKHYLLHVVVYSVLLTELLEVEAILAHRRTLVVSLVMKKNC